MNFDAYEAEKTRQTVFNFCLFDENALSALKSDLALSLPIEALLLCRDHFRFFERRDPTVGDLRFLDALAALWEGMPDTAIVEAPRFCENEDARVFSDMLQKAMETIGVESCIYVGDSEVDIRTAENSGVPCLTVLWGLRSREELEKAGAKYFCEKAEHLPTAIEKVLEG